MTGISERLAPKKPFGQHFLHEKGVIADILEAVNETAEDVLIEVGPGEGALTEGLAQKAKRNGIPLVCVELDRDRIPLLRQRYPQARIVEANAVSIDFSSLMESKNGWILVSNLPYNVGNAILMNALTCAHPPRRCVIMVQKEVGERMLDKPPRASVLSMAVQLYTHPRRLRVVGRGAFVPPPNVDSIVLVLDVKPKNSRAEDVMACIRAGFVHPRKILRKNLLLAGYAEEAVDRWYKEQGIDPSIRAQSVTLLQWEELERMV